MVGIMISILILAVCVAAVFLHLVPWRRKSLVLSGVPGSDFGVPSGGRPLGSPNPLGRTDRPSATTTATTEGATS